MNNVIKNSVFHASFLKWLLVLQISIHCPIRVARKVLVKNVLLTGAVQN